MHILIVDDDPMNAKTLSDILRLQGFEATVALSGLEALETLGHALVDCVLSDIRMPQQNGVDLCRKIKRRRPGLPVILMTAYSEERLVQEGLEEGASSVLTKPLDIPALLRSLNDLASGTA